MTGTDAHDGKLRDDHDIGSDMPIRTGVIDPNCGFGRNE